MQDWLSEIKLGFDKETQVLDAEALVQYAGTRDLAEVDSLQAVANTSEMTLSVIGDFFPRLQKLRLNNSIIPSIRDISSNLKQLRFLSLAHCQLRSLDGICTISEVLEELYLAFNHITNLSDLIGLGRLKILDLEENEIESLADIELLQCCSSLKALTLAGNPGAAVPTYRDDVRVLLPTLVYLDEKRLKLSRPPRLEPSTVVFASLDLGESDQKEKRRTKPRSSEEPTREATVTEQLFDLAGERPPTARGIYEPAHREVGGSWAKPRQKLIARPVFAPKVMRPVSSSCWRLRKSAPSPERSQAIEIKGIF
jgi:hypothetical protein